TYGQWVVSHFLQCFSGSSASLHCLGLLHEHVTYSSQTAPLLTLQTLSLRRNGCIPDNFARRVASCLFNGWDLFGHQPVATREGFEPPGPFGTAGFRNRFLQPLGHLVM